MKALQKKTGFWLILNCFRQIWAFFRKGIFGQKKQLLKGFRLEKNG